jgi:hypothetical protein
MSKIKDLLMSKDPNDRRRAIQVIAKHDDPGSTRLLKRIAATEKDPSLRELAEHYLRQREPSQSIQAEPNLSTLRQDEAASPAEESADRFLYKSLKHGKVFLLYPENTRYQNYLNGLTPHPVFTLSGDAGLDRIITYLLIGLIVLTVVVVRGTVVEWINWRQVLETGVTTEGTVTKAYIIYIGEDGNTEVYNVEYSFAAQDGVTYNGSDTVSWMTYKTARDEKRITVSYASDNPSNNRASENVNYPENLLIGVVQSAALVLLSSWGTRKLFSSRRRLAKFTRYGQHVNGQIVSASGEVDSEGDYMVRFRYSFVSPKSGRRITNETLRMRNDLRDGNVPPPGTPIAIWYLDDKTYEVL